MELITLDQRERALCLSVSVGGLLRCDFFERRGEKRIDVGTLLAFLFFNFSDGVLCFRLIRATEGVRAYP